MALPEPLSLAVTLLRHPTALRRYQRIWLLSHMRANTSLLAHVLGDHPQIDGYYELHIGYHSWRSLWRQKQRYFKEHTPKPGARYLFDKVLHSGHGVAPALLRGHKVLFALRPPQDTLPSVVKLYHDRTEGEPLATLDGAAAYYSERVEHLAALASQMDSEFCYLDANALRRQPGTTLAQLTDYLELREPLRREYTLRSKTGEARAGDSSARLRSGRIREETDNERAALVPEPLLSPCQTVFEQARWRLLSHPQLAAAVLDPTLRDTSKGSAL